MQYTIILLTILLNKIKGNAIIVPDKITCYHNLPTQTVNVHYNNRYRYSYHWKSITPLEYSLMTGKQTHSNHISSKRTWNIGTFKLSHCFQIEFNTGDMTRRTWEQTIETERETMVLYPNNNFGEKVGKHFFSDAKTHFDISKTNIASYHMVPDLKVSNITQSGRVGSNVESKLLNQCTVDMVSDWRSQEIQPCSQHETSVCMSHWLPRTLEESTTTVCLREPQSKGTPFK
jgi:hypothetical protein